MSLKPIVFQFVFDNFEGLTHENGYVKRSEVKDDGRGNSWQILIYPGGQSEASNEYLSMFLYMTAPGGGNVDAKASFTIRDATGSLHKYHPLEKFQYVAGGQAFGPTKAEKRSTILDKKNNILSNGALVVDVEIQIIAKKRKFQPTNPFLENMQQLLGGEHADVKFKVRGEILPAHKLILLANAPILAEFCGKKKTVTINNTSADVFRTVLRYVYGGEGPDENVMLSRGKEIIEAANRYDIVDLKIMAESCLVEKRALELRTAADWLVFADSNTCPMLKEYALAYITCKAKDILAHESSANLKESPELLQEVVLAMSEHKTKDHFSRADIIGYHASMMSVDELRAKLTEKGLDVDGSKEMLVSRLAASEDTGVDGTKVTP